MKILKVYGPDTPADGEQVFWATGYNCSKIETRDENFGTYGIKWFVVTTHDFGIVELNALHVFGVEYAKPE